MTKKKSLTYRSAGVDIDEGERLVGLIKPLARSTGRPGVLGSIGGFGALFDGRFRSMREPVLVSSTDGVGTKLMVAFMAGRHDTVGVDLVAMSVNDILTLGAEPLFFLDYLATGRLSAVRHSSVIKGVAAGCKEAGCALIGGETAEMPGLYNGTEYDLAGFAVGVVDRSKIIDGRSIRAGDTLIGLPSSGLHSNGYSLARKVIFDNLGLGVRDRAEGLGRRSVGNALLEPTRIYVRPVLKLLGKVGVTGMVHVTGGGFTGNVPRVLPKGLKAVIDRDSWRPPAVFTLIAGGGGVEEKEMLRTFNCGVGFIIALRKKDEAAALRALKSAGENAFVMGTVEKAARGGRRVEFAGAPLFED